jgi:uncharacterized protein YegP (UPF0339 family)
MQQLPNEPTDDDVTRFAEKFVEEHRGLQERLKNAPKFLWYKVGKDYRWRLVASTGEVLCSGQGYSRKKDMMSTIDLIKRAAAMAEVREVE